VHFKVDFYKPTGYGDRLTFNLWTRRIGRSSCDVLIKASLHGELRMTVEQTLVFISVGTQKSTPIPPEIVSRMQRFALEGDEPPQPKKPRKKAVK